MNLKLYAAAALLAVAAAGSIYGLWQRSEAIKLRTHVAALENRVAGLESSEKALRKAAETSARRTAEANKRAREAQRRLDEALKADPDWADQPVPDGVWRALRPQP